MKKQKKIHHILQSGDEAKEIKQSTVQANTNLINFIEFVINNNNSLFFTLGFGEFLTRL